MHSDLCDVLLIWLSKGGHIRGTYKLSKEGHISHAFRPMHSDLDMQEVG
jgi:hypothetical protein